MVVNAKYICSMQVDTKCYWNQKPNNHVITVPTRTILHPKLEVNAITDYNAIPASICSRTRESVLDEVDFDYNSIMFQLLNAPNTGQ